MERILMRKWIGIFIALCFLVLPTCPWAFDKEQGKFPWTDEVWDLSTTVVIVQTVGSGYGSHPVYENGKEVIRKAIGTFQITGMGTVVRHKSGELYIITAAHVVEPDTVCIQQTKNTYFTTPLLELIDSKVMITDQYGKYGVCPVKVMFKNSEKDLAILKVPKEWAARQPIGIELKHTVVIHQDHTGKVVVQDLLEIGDAVVTVAKAKDTWWYEAKKGTVRTLDGVWFTSTIIAEPGDSGSPVFVFLKGKPLYIGIVRARGYQSNGELFSQIVRLDPIVTRVFGSEGF